MIGSLFIELRQDLYELLSVLSVEEMVLNGELLTLARHLDQVLEAAIKNEINCDI